MNTTEICQSCGMPLDQDQLLGTEKNGAKNHEYCVYCYANGRFTKPDMKLSEMKVIVRTQLEKMNSPVSVIDKAVSGLPQLKRWQTGKMSPSFYVF